MKIIKKILVALLTVVILVSALFFAAVEMTIKYVEHEYAQLNPGNRLDIGGWRLSPLTVELAILDVYLEYPDLTSEQTALVSNHLAEVYLDLSLEKILDDELIVEKIRIQDLAISAQLQDGKVQALGVDLTEKVPESLPAEYHHTVQLNLKQLIVEAANLKADMQHVELARLDGLAVLLDSDPVLAFDSYQVSSFKLTEQLLDLGQHELRGLLAKVVKEKNGRIRGLIPAPVAAVERQGKEIESSEIAEQAVVENQTQQHFLLRSFSLIDSKGLSFTDMSGAETAHNQIIIDNLQLGRLDSRTPKALSDLILQAHIDEFNKISVNGALSILAESKDGQLKLNIEQLNLLPLNPYLHQELGYHVHSGQFNSQAQVGIKENQLSGEMDILLRDLVLEPTDDDLAGKITKKISMPLDTALSILRDDNNNIKINMPVTGDLNDPDIGLDDLTAQISQTALKAAVVHYLKQSLQPYGTLISLGSMAGEYLFAIRLDDIQYDKGQYQLTEGHKDYLSKVMAMMVDKDSLQLRICSYALKDEVESLQLKDPEGKPLTGWKALANLRAKDIKRYITTEKPELSPRVVLCQPQLGEELAKTELGF